MGRRKIEIKPIKDDRNRSVTFLKRKGGLFKKAHELSVLCSVDVAVIIFSGNKKLHQYCSGDVNEMINRHSYYETAHETKGPGDFGKKDLMEDDDDDDAIIGGDRAGSHSSGDHPLPHHMQHPPPHLSRQHTASASPPNMPKVLVGPSGYPLGPRVGTPQPMTRPSSRNQIRRNSSNLVPPNGYPASQPPSHQNGYSYIQHPPQHPQQQQHQQQHHQPPPPPVYGSQMLQPSNLSQMQYPQYSQPPPPQHHQPSQAAQPQSDYDTNRRQSMPPVYNVEPPAPETDQPTRSEPPPPPQPMEHKRAPAKSRSMFTPIGPSDSMLAAHFGFGARELRPPPIETSASQSGSSAKATKAEEKPVPPPLPLPPLTTSTSPPPPPSRNNSMADPKSAGMRPKLKVRIPSENSDAGSPDTSPRDTAGNAGNVSARPGNESGPVVLPPPSPSQSIGGLLSAGATGPTNPFSRPQANIHGSQPEQTPMSALPSRFMDAMLPSPGGFYSGWMDNMGTNAFSRSGAGGDSMLPSPLNFQTPVGPNPAPFFKSDSETNGNNKRRSPESDQSEGSAAKRPKNS